MTADIEQVNRTALAYAWSAICRKMQDKLWEIQSMDITTPTLIAGQRDGFVVKDLLPLRVVTIIFEDLQHKEGKE